MVPTDPRERHRQVAAGFGDLVGSTPTDAWSAPSPVAGWVARDVVRHLVDWLPGFLAGGSDVRLPGGPSVDTDPVAAWQQHARAVQALLDDPTTTSCVFEHPRLPAMPLAEAVSRFYTADVFMHTWDLACATRQDDRLDSELCRELYLGLEPMDAQLRQSGQFGPRVPVSADADWQSRLLGLIGRDPGWRAP